MPKRTKEPPFPNNPGAWLACFRHRLRVADRTPSPEEFGRLINRSGTTVRRWESGRAVPDDDDLAAMVKVCSLSPMQLAFLTSACSRTATFGAPNAEAFRAYIGEALCALPVPAMVLDSLFYIRAWNSYVDAVSPGRSAGFETGVHPVSMMLRAAHRGRLGVSDDNDALLWEGLRIFWLSTAPLCHRPEYARLLEELDQQPNFRPLWMQLALGDDMLSHKPVAFAEGIGSDGPHFRVYSQTVTFPPTYYLHIYIPDDDEARERVNALGRQGRPLACYARDLHWLRE
jgi:hypothetical protein